MTTYAIGSIEPEYTHCCIPHTGAHSPIPTSITEMQDSYEIMVPNERSVPITTVEVLVPSAFEVVTANAGDSAWSTSVSPGLVKWAGSTIPVGGNFTFRLVLRNPSIGLNFSNVYTFVVIPFYQGSLLDAWKIPVEIVQPMRIFGWDASTLALTGVSIVTMLPIIESIIRRV